ncbi:MAG: 4-(cytidine 5'-diphospho)-2-C-methyl-D-erythritol kinase [Pseudomonadota bacterium]
MTTASVFAPAKVNLTLHVTGRRADGYHLIDSLVAFASVGDQVTVHRAAEFSLCVDGPERADVPTDTGNLALQAAALLAGARGATLFLEKQLPAASGIGGGSADAAAVLRAMVALRHGSDPASWIADADTMLQTMDEQILSLGADVPMCLRASPCRARGIGGNLEFVDLPRVPAVMVNPRVPVPTASVFAALVTRENPAMPDTLPAFPAARDLIDWLARHRNDLETPALGIAPAIGEALRALDETAGCRLARMSGSGATCFGLYETAEDACAACMAIAAKRPTWWVRECEIGDWSERALPVIS